MNDTQVISPHYSHKATERRMREVIDKVYQEVFHDGGRKLVYSSEEADVMANTISRKVKDLLVSIKIPRYKFVVHVVLGEKRDQGMFSASKQMWDDMNDRISSVSYSNDSFFVTTTTYSVYQH